MKLLGFNRMWLLGVAVLGVRAIVWGQSTEFESLFFDFGTQGSPVTDGAVQVTADSVFSENARFGFVGGDRVGFDRDRPLPELRHSGNPMRPDLLYRDHATPLLQDGVAATADLEFKVAVPNGRYRVQIWIGDLHHPRESIGIRCQGETVARGLSVKHLIGRSRPEATGFYRWVRFDVVVENEQIALGIFRDEHAYHEAQARYDRWFGKGERVGTYLGGDWDPAKPLKFDPNGPFTAASLLGLRIAPIEGSGLRWENGRLKTVGQSGDVERRFVAALNAGNLDRAEGHIAEPGWSGPLRLQAMLSLVGHPKVEGAREERWLQRAISMVNSESGEGTDDIRWVEAQESLGLFARARQRFLGRGRGEEGHFQENRKAVSMMRLLADDDLLRYKALVYQGRALQMLDPHRWVYPSGDGRIVWERLGEFFPENRYVQYYLKDDWLPDGVWSHGDHLPDDPLAPAWALAQREAWGLLLTICEWWADHKQQVDGGIGGGWGDDVELVALFGLMGFISEGTSPNSLALARNLINGLWQYGAMDVASGFYRGVLDAEHSAEWTGDTLPLMLTIDWENPVWVERAVQSAHLMRHLWMDYNDRGDLHFRSNFLGSIAVGPGQTANDSYINYRAALPAVAAYRYNRSPTIAALFVEWADAWLAAAMRTDRGKPKGVFPAEVGFPGGELGGVGSPNWYTAAHPPGTVNYDWARGSYYGYLVDLMFLAHEITGDLKYFEPFRLQKKWVDAWVKSPVGNPMPGSPLWVGKVLADETRRGALSFASLWKRLQERLAVQDQGDAVVLLEPAEVQDRMDHVRREMKRRWPVLTTETSATDRVGFRGIADPFLIMTGAEDMKPSVTYSGLGRDFAAYVRRQDERLLEVVLYLFSDQERQAEIVPWKLAAGASYRVRCFHQPTGGDTTREIQDLNVDLSQRGQRLPITLVPRSTTRILVEQLNELQPAARLLPDVAVISEEIRYSIWTRDLQATLHNVGAADARKVRVRFLETDHGDRRERTIGEVVIPRIGWPSDLEKKTLTVAVPYVPEASDVTVDVIVDEAEEIVELCESNNRAARRFQFDLDEIRAPRNRVGEIGGDVTSEIKRGIR